MGAALSEVLCGLVASYFEAQISQIVHRVFALARTAPAARGFELVRIQFK